MKGYSFSVFGGSAFVVFQDSTLRPSASSGLALRDPAFIEERTKGAFALFADDFYEDAVGEFAL
jgi:hypothetical protein